MMPMVRDQARRPCHSRLPPGGGSGGSAIAISMAWRPIMAANYRPSGTTLDLIGQNDAQPPHKSSVITQQQPCSHCPGVE